MCVCEAGDVRERDGRDQERRGNSNIPIAVLNAMHEALAWTHHDGANDRTRLFPPRESNVIVTDVCTIRLPSSLRKIEAPRFRRHTHSETETDRLYTEVKIDDDVINGAISAANATAEHGQA